MNTDNDQAGPSVPVLAKRQRSNKEPVIHLSTCDFREVLESDSFVDKTLLIETIFSCKNTILVTAPPKFGKTVNVYMLKRFLCIEVDKSGNRITKSKENEPVCDTENYKLFSQNIPKLPERKLKIAEEEEIMKEHLGKYPVIHIDFHCSVVKSFKDAVKICKTMVHEIYKEHSYLCKSLKLDASVKSECRKWCSESEYKSFDHTDVESSLQDLSEYLFEHFNHKCFVIVDEYDRIWSESMFNVDKKTLIRIIKFYTTILNYLLKHNEENVRSGFITGVFDFFNELNNICPYIFLQDERFFNFYGLTFDEVEDLRKRFSLEESEFQNVVEYYNGYEYDEKKIFSIWSVISYLKFRKIENYWKNSGAVVNLAESLKILEVRSELNILLSHSDNTIEIRNYEKIAVDDIIELKEILMNPDIHLSYTDLYFYFLLSHGYFSICKIDLKKNTVVIRIPNNEMRLELQEKLK